MVLKLSKFGILSLFLSKSISARISNTFEQDMSIIVIKKIFKYWNRPNKSTQEVNIWLIISLEYSNFLVFSVSRTCPLSIGHFLGHQSDQSFRSSFSGTRNHALSFGFFQKFCNEKRIQVVEKSSWKKTRCSKVLSWKVLSWKVWS